MIKGKTAWYKLCQIGKDKGSGEVAFFLAEQ